MVRKILINLALVATSFLSVTSSQAQSGLETKRYEDAGLCLGAMQGATAKGAQMAQLSDVAKKNIVKALDQFSGMDKWASAKDSCNKNGTPLAEIKNCIDQKIGDKNAATFWKAYILGAEFTYKKSATEGLSNTNGLCVTLK